MNIRDRRGLKCRARESVDHAGAGLGRLALIYGAVSLLVPLLVDWLSLLVATEINYTGGLDGMGEQAMFQSVTQLLSLAVGFTLPFWNVGMVFMSLQLLRREQLDNRSLFAGFRRFGPVLRLMLLESGILFGVVMVASFAATFVALPFSGELLQTLEPMILENPTMDAMTMMELIPADQLMSLMAPMLITMVVILLAGFLPIFYRIRLAEYVIFDAPGTGALAALSFSFRFTKGNVWQQFRLDLSLWWFYVLNVVTAGIALCPDILALAGVKTGLGLATEYLIFGGLAALGNLAVYRFFLPYVQTVYAAAFEAMRDAVFLPKLQQNSPVDKSDPMV